MRIDVTIGMMKMQITHHLDVPENVTLNELTGRVEDIFWRTLGAPPPGLCKHRAILVDHNGIEITTDAELAQKIQELPHFEAFLRDRNFG